MRTLLTIAGFDPSSGAGVTADMMAFAAHGHFGVSAITSLTVQSTLGVRSSHPVDPEVLADTLDCLVNDLPFAGIKVGMLGTSANVAAVIRFVEQVRASSDGAGLPVIVDPVIRSSSGRELLDQAGVQLLMDGLLPLADWVTPNVDELAQLTGRAVTDADEMLSAAKSLQSQIQIPALSRRSAIHVLAKGGHFDPPDDLLLMPDGAAHWLCGQRIDTRATHGTGCALSSAILSRLAHGELPVDAAGAAKAYVAEAMRRAVPIGHGNGPMNHLWPLKTVDTPG